MTAAAPTDLGAATYATLDGARVVRATLRVPGAGAWVADVELDEVPETPPTGRVSLVIGGLTLSGTVAPSWSGSFALQAWVRVVAGAGAWSKLVEAQGYHNDAPIQASQVLEDAAAAVGEQLVVDAGDRELGVDFLREAGPASRVFGQVLDDEFGWWVDYDGVTHVGQRAPVVADPNLDFDLLDYEPEHRLLTLATDTPGVVQVGQTIQDDRLEAPVTVRELEVDVSAAGVRVRCWVAEVATPAAPQNRLMRALHAAVRSALPQLAYLAPVRFRVVQQVGDRFDLQNVDPRSKLPDQRLVRVAPGVAGAGFALTPGTVVLVQFVDGDPSQPLITQCAPTDDAAFEPGGVTIDAIAKVDPCELNMSATALANKSTMKVDVTAGAGEAKHTTTLTAGAGDAKHQVVVTGGADASDTSSVTAEVHATSSSDATAIGNAKSDRTATGGATSHTTMAAVSNAQSGGSASTALTATATADATASMTATATATANMGMSATADTAAHVVIAAIAAETTDVTISAFAPTGQVVIVAGGATLVLNAAMIAKLNAL